MLLEFGKSDWSELAKNILLFPTAYACLQVICVNRASLLLLVYLSRTSHHKFHIVNVQKPEAQILNGYNRFRAIGTPIR